MPARSLTTKPEEVHPMEIDPRGPRFGAVITMIVFGVVMLTGSAWLLAVQALFFAIGTVFGLPRSPYGLVYRWSRLLRRVSPRRLAWLSVSSA
jgi:hypothetical protein